MLIEIEKYLKKSNNFESNKLRKDLLESLNVGLQSVDPFICVNNYFYNQEIKPNKKNIEIQNINFQNNSFPNFEENIDNIDYLNIKNIYLIGFGKAVIRMSLAIIIRFNLTDGIICSNEEISNIEEKFLSIFNTYKSDQINIIEYNKNNIMSIAFNSEQMIKTNSKKIKYIKGGHPLPDENSIKAGNEIIKILEKANEEDLIFVLISGGGSALVEKPIIDFDTLKSITADLLKKGANIHELNTIRKHLSALKGGRIIQKSKAKIISLILSDVPGDPLESIASGPTYHDSTTFEMALSILKKYELTEKYPQIEKIFNDGINGKILETLKEKEYNEQYERGKIENFLVGSNYICCQSIIKILIVKNYNVIYLGSLIEGDAEEIANLFFGFFRSIFKNQFGFSSEILRIKDISINDSFYHLPLAIVWGGETTVKVRGNGKGGRNQHFVLSFLNNIRKNKINIDLLKYLFSICSFGTDGIDGVSIAAGAIADNWSVEFIEKNNIDTANFIKNSDSFTFFEKLGDAIITGPTGTNVTDVGVLLIDKKTNL
jgi:hydroxypyruvate reductase/glycerate 2-kinase